MLIKLVFLAGIVLTTLAVSDCLKRRENISWLFIILFFWWGGIGPLIYFAYTRNWVHTLPSAGASRGRSYSSAKARAQHEDTPQAWREFGISAFRKGCLDEAILALERVISSEGLATPLDARYYLGLAYKKNERYKDAIVQLGLIARENPKYRSGEALSELAECLAEQGDTDKALEAFERLMEVSSLPRGRYQYGVLLDRSGRHKDAVEQMQRIVREQMSAPDHVRKQNRKYVRLAQNFLTKHG